MNAILQNIFQVFFPNLLMVYCSLSVFIFFGWLILNFFYNPFGKQNSCLLLFLCLLASILVVVFFYSVFVSGFRTVHLGLVPLVAFFLYELKNFWMLPNIKNIFSKLPFFSRETIAFFFAIPFAFSLWQIFPFIHQRPFPFLTIDKDYIYAGRLSEFLNITGEENRYFEGNLLLLNVFHGVVPYHYFELWLNAALSFFWQTNHTVSLIMLTRIILLTAFAFGLLALTEKIFKNETVGKNSKLLLKITGLFFVFFSGFPVAALFASEYLKYSDEVLHHVLMQFFQKTVTVYIFMVSFLLAVLYEKTTLGILAFLSLAIFYFPCAPGVCFGTFFCLVILWIFRLLSRKIFLRCLIYYLSVFSFLYFFYLLLGNSMTNEMMREQLGNFKTYFTRHDYRLDAYYLLLIIPLTTLAGFLVWGLMIVFSCRKNFRQLFKNSSMKILCLVTLFAYAGGLFSWLGLHFLGYSASQFYTCLIPPALNLLFMTALLFSFRKKVLLFISFILVFLFFNAWRTYQQNNKEYLVGQSFLYSEKYMLKTANLHSRFHGQPIVFLLDSTAYSFPSHKNTYDYIPLKHLAFLPGTELLVSLDVFNIQQSKELYHNFEDERERKISVFYQFCLRQKQNGRFISYEQSQEDFINEYKVKFLVLGKNAKPCPHLQSRFASVVQDENTGEQFITLK